MVSLHWWSQAGFLGIWDFHAHQPLPPPFTPQSFCDRLPSLCLPTVPLPATYLHPWYQWQRWVTSCFEALPRKPVILQIWKKYSFWWQQWVTQVPMYRDMPGLSGETHLPWDNLGQDCDERLVKCLYAEWYNLGFKHPNKYHIQFCTQLEVTSMKWVGSDVRGGRGVRT